jgi:hypothetical protein
VWEGLRLRPSRCQSASSDITSPSPKPHVGFTWASRGRLVRFTWISARRRIKPPSFCAEKARFREGLTREHGWFRLGVAIEDIRRARRAESRGISTGCILPPRLPFQNWRRAAGRKGLNGAPNGHKSGNTIFNPAPNGHPMSSNHRAQTRLYGRLSSRVCATAYRLHGLARLANSTTRCGQRSRYFEDRSTRASNS